MRLLCEKWDGSNASHYSLWLEETGQPAVLLYRVNLQAWEYMEAKIGEVQIQQRQHCEYAGFPPDFAVLV